MASDTTIIVLEEMLTQIAAEYKRRCLEVSITAQKAYNIELRLRAVAELIERESKGSKFQYSQAKILEDHGLKGVKHDDEV